MPRYFFNVYDGTDAPDGTGTDLADLRAVRQEALRFVSNLLGEEPLRLALGETWTLEITNEAGVAVLELQVTNRL